MSEYFNFEITSALVDYILPFQIQIKFSENWKSLVLLHLNRDENNSEGVFYTNLKS